MILVDTTVWIDLFLDHETPQVKKLENLILQQEDLCTCGVIMTEILQGIRSDQEYLKILSVLTNLLYLPMDQSVFIQSSNIFRTLRKKGITIRKSIDCMIAAVCIEHNCQLLHNDRDFAFIADSFPLQLTNDIDG